MMKPRRNFSPGFPGIQIVLEHFLWICSTPRNVSTESHKQTLLALYWAEIGVGVEVLSKQ